MPNSNDDVLEPEAPEQPQAQPAQAGSPYDGMIAQNAQGHRVVYRSNATGRGRWVEVNPANADAASRTALTNERALLSRLRDTSRSAEDFLHHNTQRGTGGLDTSDVFPNWGQPHRQAMEGLAANMVRANIQPGQASTMNSDAEQQMAARTYPTPEAYGNVNAERAVRVFVNRDVQNELVHQMEEWLSQHPTMTGFQEHWQSIEPGLRQQITRLHAARWPGVNNEGRYDGADGRHQRVDNAPPRAQQTTEFRRNPQTGEIERVR